MPRTPPRRPARPVPTVAVVGGGIAGLAAAWELTGGARGPASDTPAVIVLEADGILGGKLQSVAFGGRRVDVGPDAFLGRRPEAAELCRELGLGDGLMPIAASGAAVWARGRRRKLPDSLVMGIPTRFWPVARSGILGGRGTLRLLRDVLAPRTDARGPLGDRAIGPLIARKLGQRVVNSLVDPLLGGIQAGGVADMSTAATFPLLLAVAQRRGGLMSGLRRASSMPEPASPAPVEASEGNGAAGEMLEEPAAEPPGEPTGEEVKGAEHARRSTGGPEEPPLFWSLRGGMASLVDRISTCLTERGATLRVNCAVESLHRQEDGPSWVLDTPDGSIIADGVVLALPAPAAAELLTPHDGDAATLLGGIEYASVAIVTLAYPEDAPNAPLSGTGFLVPRDTPAPAECEVEGNLLVTACSYLSSKWPHLDKPGELLVRASVGRFDDERFASMSDAQIVERTVIELGALAGLYKAPVDATVTRWPSSFPQYRVHHLLRVAGIEAAVKRLPAVAVAGSAYRGVGIPACIASGRGAARTILEALAGAPAPATPAR